MLNQKSRLDPSATSHSLQAVKERYNCSDSCSAARNFGVMQANGQRRQKEQHSNDPGREIPQAQTQAMRR